LTAGGDVDTTPFDVDGVAADDQALVVLQVVHSLTAAGQVVLACIDQGIGDLHVAYTKITAIRVAQLTNTGV
jgi:hypothetical protein